MQTSHKLTRILLGLTALVSLAAMSFGQVFTKGATAEKLNQIEVSDQKPGSILVYPYYTSNAQTKADTRVTLTNLAGTLSGLNDVDYNANWQLKNGTIYAHIFFLNGANCAQADMYVCLTKGASITFNASTQDPDITGYIIAVAVNEMGRPVSWNALIGNAFVSTADVVGNYGAEAFASTYRPGQETIGDREIEKGELKLNGAIYDRGADQFAVEIQSPATAAGQTVVHASVDGDIAAGSTNSISQLNTGLVIRGDEKQGSFVGFLSGGCLSTGSIRVDRPRVPTGMGAFVPAGQIATLVYNTNRASVGLLLTPKANAWSGIRGLHKTRTKDSSLTIPVFMPVC
jgi:hypothetical protein